MTEIKSFLCRSKEPVDSRRAIWSAPFPLHRDPTQSDVSSADPLTYGDYFSAVRRFLEKNACRFLKEAISEKTKTKGCPQNIQSIHIHLEKHGAFYHPSRVVARSAGRNHVFVLNAAVSRAGKTAIHREYAVMKRLRKDFPWRYIPAVYAVDAVSVRDGRTEMILFLGEWFEGYHEFHLSGGPTGDQTGIVLWNEAEGYRKLPQRMVLPLFRQAAKIMTSYYNLCSFEQISSWHHAAGDFILAICGNRLDMRLISVRQYASIIDNTRSDPEFLIHALLLFLLDLSLRMRVDRIDGTGELIWADDRAVAGTVNGFFDGLSRQSQIDPLAEPLAVLFTDYVRACKPGDLIDVAGALVDARHPHAPETGLMRSRLSGHCATLHKCLKGLFP